MIDSVLPPASTSPSSIRRSPGRPSPRVARSAATWRNRVVSPPMGRRSKLERSDRVLRPTERSSWPRMVMTHAVVDVGRWLEGKDARAAAIGAVGTNVPTMRGRRQ